MCGICGYIDFRRKPDRKILNKMLNSIRYRGPDSWGIHTDQVALGVRRLKIIDLTTGDQPIYNEDKTAVIVFNGEIYNYKPLRESLLKRGHVFRTRTDTEVLIHLYEDKGLSMLPLLNGMFAFALWDKAKKQLLLARDRYGVKSLYYLKTENGIIFGSEIKTILEHPSVKVKINVGAVSSYATFGYVPLEATIYKSIKKLQPGEYALIRPLCFTKKKYWNQNEIAFTIDKSLKSLMFSAIELQAQSDVPVGVLLSGGIDSSLIAYYLQKCLNVPIHSFSIGFDNEAYDERSIARLAATKIGTIHHEEKYTPKKMLEDFEIIKSKLDEPFADPSLFPTFALARLAHATVKVALSGDGGDELFGGYPTYQGHLAANLLQSIPQTLLDRILQIIFRLPVSDNKNYPLSQILPIFIKHISKSVNIRHLLWMSELMSGSSNFLRSPYRIKNTLNQLTSSLEDIPLEENVTAARSIDVATYLPNDLLFKSDRASMYNSLELRVPFLDNDLYNFAFTQSGNQHVSLLQTKKMLREHARTILPATITERKKKGFGIPLAQWLRDELRNLVECELSRDSLYEFFDYEAVQTLWHLHLSKKTDASKKIWNIVMFSSWLENVTK